jgi:hypothetical protein
LSKQRINEGGFLRVGMKAIREYQIALLATAGFNQIHRHVICIFGEGKRLPGKLFYDDRLLWDDGHTMRV